MNDLTPMFWLTITAHGVSEGQSVRGLDIGTHFGELEFLDNTLSIENPGERGLVVRMEPSQKEFATEYGPIPKEGQTSEFNLHDVTYSVERLQ